MALPSDPQEAQEDVAYIEAEIASLKEELEATNITSGLKRKEFVMLRIARLEKEVPKIKEKAKLSREHLEWLARINNTKRT